MELNYLISYLDNREQDSSFSADNIFKDIKEWLATPESVASDGVYGLMDRSKFGRVRPGMKVEMQAAFSGEGGKICGGCQDEVFSVRALSSLFSCWAR